MRQHVLTALSVVCALAGLSLILELVAQRQLSAAPLPTTMTTTPSTAPAEPADPCPAPGGRAPSINTKKCLAGNFAGNYFECGKQKESRDCNRFSNYNFDDTFYAADSSTGAVLFTEDPDFPLDCSRPKVNRRCAEESEECHRYTFCFWDTTSKAFPFCAIDANDQGPWLSGNKLTEKKCDPNKN